MNNRNLLIYESIELFRILDEIKDLIHFNIIHLSIKDLPKYNEMDLSKKLLSPQAKDNHGDTPVGPTSLKDLRKGRTVCGDCGSDPTVKPKWLNSKVYDPAQLKDFYERNMFSIIFYSIQP